MALHRRSYGNEPRVMVSTDGISNIPLNMSRDQTNAFGIGVLPSFSSYSPSSVQVNLNDLPEGVDVDNRVMTSTGQKGPSATARSPPGREMMFWASCEPRQACRRWVPASRWRIAVKTWVSSPTRAMSGWVPYSPSSNSGNRGDASQCRFTLPSHLTNLSQLMLPCQ